MLTRDHYPNFIIIGAPKAGTTSLAAMLEHHPDIFLATPKEPHYFSLGWERRRQAYEALFAGRPERFRGEASTTYSGSEFLDSVPDRIWQTIPDTRLIYLLRHPLERIRSQYLHWVDRGKEDRSIEAAVRGDPRYIGDTRYGQTMKAYLQFFPRSQVLIVDNEALRHDPYRLVREVSEFIGADPQRLGSFPVAQLNRSIDKRQSARPTRWLREWARNRGARRFVSPRARKLIHRSLSRSIDEDKAAISSELASHIWSALEADQRLLRTFVEPEFPDWRP